MWLKISPVGSADQYVNADTIAKIAVVQVDTTWYIKIYSDHSGSGPTYTLNDSYASVGDANTALDRLATVIGGVDVSIYA